MIMMEDNTIHLHNIAEFIFKLHGALIWSDVDPTVTEYTGNHSSSLIRSMQSHLYLELTFFKLSSKFWSVCNRNLHLFIPTLAFLGNHGSKMKTGLTSSAALQAAKSAGLSCNLSPLRNQWIAQVFITHCTDTQI